MKETNMHDNNITQLDLPALHEYFYVSKDDVESDNDG